MEHRTRFARTPGSMSGKGPTDYGTGRRCACGAAILRYTKGALCNLCTRDKNRREHYAANPKDTTMEPAKIKASLAAKQLGVTGKELKQLERDGRLEAHTRGRGLFGSVFLVDDVDRLQTELEAERLVADAARASDQDPVAERVAAETEPDDEPAEEAAPCCGNKDDGGCFGPSCTKGRPGVEPEHPCDGDPESCRRGEGCGQPGTCSYVEGCAEDCDGADETETREGAINRLMLRFGEHYARHLAAVEGVRRSTEVFAEALGDAKDAAADAELARKHLLALDVQVEGVFALPPYLVPPTVELVELAEDPEIRAMAQISEALEALDRDAQIRAVRWATSKFGIDRPLPKPQTLELDSLAATDTAPTSPV